MEGMDLDGGSDGNVGSELEDQTDSDPGVHTNSDWDGHADAGAAGGPSIVGSAEGEDDAMGSDSS